MWRVAAARYAQPIQITEGVRGMGSMVETRAVSAGDARVDAMARQREAAHAPALQARACDGCGGATGEKDFTVCSWSYYFSKLGALSVLAALLGKVLVLTRVVRHATHHWICPACANRVRAA